MSARANMPSPVFAELENFVLDEYRHLDRECLTPWVFFNAGPPMRVEDFYGRQIGYQGIEFSGSPRDVFWGNFIEPFLRDLTVRTAAHAVELADSRRILRSDALADAQVLLNGVVHGAYERMQDIDRRLRGKGHPSKVAPEDISPKRENMEAFVARILHGWSVKQPLPDRISDFYNNHQIVFWAVALLVSAVIGVLAL